MKVGTGMQGGLVAEIPQKVRKAEELGYDFFSTSETKHNPFVTAALAAEHAKPCTGADLDCAGICSQSDGHSVYDVGPAIIVGRSLSTGAWQPGARSHRQALQHALGQTGSEDAGVYSGDAPHLGELAERGHVSTSRATSTTST